MRYHARQILKEPPGGVRNLYHGVMTTITRAAVLGATKMATYDQCKVELKEGSWTRGFGWTESRDDPERWTERYKVQFAASIVTGLAVTMTTSPVTNARTHIMCNPHAAHQSVQPHTSTHSIEACLFGILLAGVVSIE